MSQTAISKIGFTCESDSRRCRRGLPAARGSPGRRPPDGPPINLNAKALPLMPPGSLAVRFRGRPRTHIRRINFPLPAAANALTEVYPS